MINLEQSIDYKSYINKVISNNQLVEMFRCPSIGGIRKSVFYNAIVIVGDFNSKQFINRFDYNNQIIHFNGVGSSEIQDVSFRGNKLINESNSKGTSLFFFEKVGSKGYKLIDKVKLVDSPYYIEKGNNEILVFPLGLVGNEVNITDLLKEIGINTLIETYILSTANNYLTSKSIDPLISLMKEKNIDTLTGAGGWFLTKNMYFYNGNASGKKNGNLKNNEFRKFVFVNQNYYLNPFYNKSLVFKPEKNKLNMVKNIEENSGENNAFRLIELNLSGDYFQQENEFKITFSHSKFDNNEPYTTVIIGPNGTGKSRVLTAIEKIFNEINSLKDGGASNKMLPNYTIKYKVNKATFIVKRNDLSFEFYKNNENVSIEELLLPKRLLASSYLMNSDFTFKRTMLGDDSFYQYLGVKETSNAIYKNTTMKKLASSIIELSSVSDLFDNLNHITNLLKLSPFFEIIFYSSKINIFDNEQYLRHDLESIIQKNKNRRTSKITNQGIEDILYYISRVKTSKSLKFEDLENRKNKIIMQISANNNKFDIEAIEDYNCLSKLMNYGIIDLEDVKIEKKSLYSVEQASSGESNYIYGMLSIMSKIRDNSLIIIDEPEISLHPNWQYSYIDMLKKIFANYSTCHFIIATHSHFMISDLKENSSDLISFDYSEDNYGIHIKNHKGSTYGKSAEEILLDIFKLATTRNYYLADEIDKVLYDLNTITNKNKYRNEVIDKVKWLKIISDGLKDVDPLKEIIENIAKKVGLDE